MVDYFLPYNLSLIAKDNNMQFEVIGYYYPEAPDELYHAKLYKIVSPFLYRDSDYVIDAPLYDQAIDWFFNEHKLDISIRVLDDTGRSYWKISKLYDDGNIKGYSGFGDNKRECLNNAIEKAFKIIK